MRRIAGGASLGVVAVGSVVGGTGVAQAEQTVSSHGVTVTVPDSCDVYLQSGLARSFPDSGHTQRCLAEKGLSTPAATDVSTVPTPDGAGSSTTSSGSSTTTTTTTSTPSAPTTSSTPSSTPSSAAPAATPVRTESGATSTDPDDQPAAPGETKSVPIG